jgi:hypothetical protein
MTDDQRTPEPQSPEPSEGEQDVEGHKIPRPGGTQGGFDGGPDGVRLTPSDEDDPRPDGVR